MTDIYRPSKNILTRIHRKLTSYQARNTQNIDKNRAIISLTFDDCPVSGIHNGVRQFEKEGWQCTVYVACGLFETINHLGRVMHADDAKALHQSGHEIGEHTFSHLDAYTTSLESFEADIDRNQQTLNKLGIPQSRTMAYPYGVTYPALKHAMQKRFKGARGVKAHYHKNKVDLNQIGSAPLFVNAMEPTMQAVKNVAKTGGWLTLFTHDVDEEPSQWGCTPQHIKTITHMIKSLGIEVMPVEQVISELGRSA